MPKSDTYVILPDVHAPFHNPRLIRKVCQVIRHVEPTGIIITGDFLDLFTLSSYAADSLQQLRKFTLTEEYKSGNAVLDELDDAMGKCPKRHFMYGNHEDRYFRELERGDRAKYGQELRSPADALRLAERGYAVYENWKDDVVRLGAHLEVTHGIYTNIHTAYKHVQEFQGSVVFGHSHRIQTHVLGKRAGFNIGCLCDIDSKGFSYMARPMRMKWCNGFAIAHIDERGDFHVETIQAHGETFYANGRRY